MKYFANVILLLVLLLAGCSSPEAWSSALEETAPPDPNRAHIDSGDAEPEVETTPAENTPQENRQAQESAPQPVDPGPQPTRITAVLPDYPNCHVGAVRFYVNRRYKGAFDEEGSVTVNVPPGELTLEVWDSDGHWIKKMNISEGQTLQVTFSCAEKSTKVQGIERQTDEG